MSEIQLYVNVILPTRFRETVTYSVPSHIQGQVQVGSVVKAKLIGREYLAVVESITESPDFDSKRIKPLVDIENIKPITQDEITFWKQIAQYYMCSLGEVMTAAVSLKIRGERKLKPAEAKDYVPVDITESDSKLPKLSSSQQSALDEISNSFKKTSDKVVLLNGVTGSGKTEVYIHLINTSLQKGKNVLYMLPEVAVSRQLGKRLEKVFGNRVLIYHSKQTISKKRTILELLLSKDNNSGYVILGLRSSVFLPIPNLDLIIVDEEHDTSYKQSEPTPRYNGRDAAILLSKIKAASVLLGTATPSLETNYNVATGKYKEVLLEQRFNKLSDPEVEVVDMRKEREKWAVKGSFSKILLREIEQRLAKGEQVMIFRSRRSYSPAVQCRSCGEVVKCQACNVPLSYHKSRNTLDCHYCGQSRYFSNVCLSCSKDTVGPVGAGTEKIEEELAALFPESRIARFDADTTKNKSDEERILKGFARKEIDILVGTQMISKGFDFENLTLVAVISGESVLSLNNFRADEYAFQLLTQLKGRAGRHKENGKMLIQTNLPEHPVYAMLRGGVSDLLFERKEYEYPPYKRLINITIRDKYKDRLERRAYAVRKLVQDTGVTNFAGPFPPPLDSLQGVYSLQFIIKLDRNVKLLSIKNNLYAALSASGETLIIDVDPI